MQLKKLIFSLVNFLRIKFVRGKGNILLFLRLYRHSRGINFLKNYPTLYSGNFQVFWVHWKIFKQFMYHPAVNRYSKPFRVTTNRTFEAVDQTLTSDEIIHPIVNKSPSRPCNKDPLLCGDRVSLPGNPSSCTFWGDFAQFIKIYQRRLQESLLMCRRY